MRSIVILLTLLLLVPLFVCPPSKAQDAPVDSSSFLKDIEDVPVPEGFTQNEEEPLVYDTPDGRIVETSVEGTGDAKEVAEFYEKTLPQLGWKKDAQLADSGLNLTFEKEKEKLKLFIKRDELRVEIKFALYPAKKR